MVADHRKEEEFKKLKIEKSWEDTQVQFASYAEGRE
jgi:hypothetical protein